MLVLGGQPSWIVTTRITALLNINILGNNQKKKYNREHAVIRKDGVAKSLYHQDNRDFRAGACEGAGELDNAREPANRARPKAEDSTKEREKFVQKK